MENYGYEVEDEYGQNQGEGTNDWFEDYEMEDYKEEAMQMSK